MIQATQYFRSLAFLILAASALMNCGLIQNEESPANTPIIERFVAAPNPASPGDTVMLRWDVSGAESVRIDPDIGIVPITGLQEVQPAVTTSYTLSANSGTTGATATIEVVVAGTSPEDPTPTPTVTPTPGASVTPTPSASVTPTPLSSVTPIPAASVTPTPVAPTPTPASTPNTSPTPACGTAPSTTKGCGVTITEKASLPSGECLQLTQVAVSRGCPVGFNVTRAISFRIQATTAAGSLSWRRGSQTADVVSPSNGSISPSGSTDVALEQTVLSQALVIEIVDAGRVLMRFSIDN